MNVRHLLFLPSSIIACSTLCALRLLVSRQYLEVFLLRAGKLLIRYSVLESLLTVYSCRNMHEMWEKKFGGFLIMQKKLRLARSGLLQRNSVISALVFSLVFACCGGFFLFVFFFNFKRKKKPLNWEQSPLLLQPNYLVNGD